MTEVEWMIREIELEVKETRGYLGRDHLNPRVRQALLDVPRDQFVPDPETPYAYENRPLPIGWGQTISQPYIVAVMTDLLDLEPHHRVLEAGTGSGYQAAVLSRLVQQVYTMERVPELAREAGERLKRLGYENVETRVGDAWEGWPEAAPYDGILVTAAAPVVPEQLLEQLAPGGRMVVPVGGGYGQDLLLLSKGPEGRIDRHKLLPVAFVPFIGGPDGDDRGVSGGKWPAT